MTPEQLWKLAIKGNQKAWQQVYELFGGRLYQFFLKNTQNPELSMDKVQEVFLKIYRNKEGFKYGNLKTWIFRIARNLLIDEWRKAGKKEILSEVNFDIKDESVQLEEQVLHEIEQKEMVKKLDFCLAKLAEPDRLIIGLVYLGNLSIPELSEAMNIPLGTAKTKVRQARLKLNRLLTEQIKTESMEN